MGQDKRGQLVQGGVDESQAQSNVNKTETKKSSIKTKKKALPRGITLRDTGENNTLYINFTYQGVRCREPLTGWLTDASNITAAANLRGAILTEIKNKTFKYADHFPSSNKCAIFGGGVSNASVAYYLDKVVSQAKERGLKPSSIQTYSVRVKDLKTRVGARLISGFDEGDVRDLALTLAADQQYESVKNTLKVLQTACHEALIEGVIPRSPFATFSLNKYVKRPTKKARRAGVMPFTPDELLALVAVCQSEREALLVKCWAKCGFRNGELCALRWADVDVDMGVVSICENYVSHVGQTGTPKTENSQRDILLDSESRGLFARLEALANDDQEKHSRQTADTRLVFENPNSARENLGWDNYALRRLFMRLYKVSGVTVRKIYNMRHTYAVMRISLGHNLWDIAEQMGHNSPEMLYQTYGRYLEQFQPEQLQGGAKSPTGDTVILQSNIFH